MFCDQCGAQLQTGQAHCVAVVKRLPGPTGIGRNRVREHVKTGRHSLDGLLVVVPDEGVLMLFVAKFVVISIRPDSKRPAARGDGVAPVR